MPDGLLIVDKQGGMSSHDVVSLVRKALRTRAVGHAGTLDPMATGVLVLGIGMATRLLRFLTFDDKRYEATLQLGIGTDSLDADGVPCEWRPVPAGLGPEQVAQVAQRFVGEIEQQVPVVSAVKQEGEALYKRWRKGQEVVAPVRRVRVHELSIERVERHEVDFAVSCSKGFYVRSLGRDLAAALGTVGHLSALRRTESGVFGLARAVPSTLLREAADDEVLRGRVIASVLPLSECVAGMPRLRVTEVGEAHLRHGRPMPIPNELLDGDALPPEADTPVAAFSQAGLLVAIVRRSGDCLEVLRGFPKVTPSGAAPAGGDHSQGSHP